MEDRELRKIEGYKENIRKYLSRLFNTSSVTAEASITEDMIKVVKKLSIEELIDFSSELDTFGKCVFHYRLPIDIRINISFSKATEVPIEERLAFWKDYKEKLNAQKLNPEEEYNKIILMACTLHVPINEPKVESEFKATEAAEPTELTEATEATEATELIEVTEPTEPTEPTGQTESEAIKPEN